MSMARPDRAARALPGAVKLTVDRGHNEIERWFEPPRFEGGKFPDRGDAGSLISAGPVPRGVRFGAA